MSFLLVDIGSTYIKSALFAANENCISRIRRYKIHSFCISRQDISEISIIQLASFIRQVIAEAEKIASLEGILFSVQMHGMLLRNNKGQPLGNYITWQDKRNLHPNAQGKTSFEKTVQALNEDIIQSVGGQLNPRQTVSHLVAWKDHYGTQDCSVSLLGDALIEELCGHPVPIHETEACSTGLYDIYKKCWHSEAIDRLKLQFFRFPSVTAANLPIAVYQGSCSSIPIYAAVGDQQAGMMGVFLSDHMLLANISTGAQLISLQGTDQSSFVERRCYFEGKRYSNISGLPGGQALNAFIDFIRDIGLSVYDIPDVETKVLWEQLFNSQDLSANGFPDACISFLRPYGITIRGSECGHLSAKKLAALFLSALVQCFYDAYLSMHCDAYPYEGVILTGGVARKTICLGKLVQEKFNLPVVLAPYEEDVLIGLARLAAVYTGVYSDVHNSEALRNQLTIQ